MACFCIKILCKFHFAWKSTSLFFGVIYLISPDLSHRTLLFLTHPELHPLTEPWTLLSSPTFIPLYTQVLKSTFRCSSLRKSPLCFQFSTLSRKPVEFSLSLHCSCADYFLESPPHTRLYFSRPVGRTCSAPPSGCLMQGLECSHIKNGTIAKIQK